MNDADLAYRHRRPVADHGALGRLAIAKEIEMKVHRAHLISHASTLFVVGSLLWLVRMPTIELGALPGFPGQEAGPAILSTTYPGVAFIGLAAIAAGMALYAAAMRSQSIMLAGALMIGGLSLFAAVVVMPSDADVTLCAGFGLFAAGCAAAGVAFRSRLLGGAAVALGVYAITVLPSGPFGGLYVIHDLAPAAFGATLLTFGLRAVLDRPATAAGPAGGAGAVAIA